MGRSSLLIQKINPESAMYLCKELTTNSLPVIGRQFNGRDHTTVLHAWRKVAPRRADYRGYLQADDYAGYHGLFRGGRVVHRLAL